MRFRCQFPQTPEPPARQRAPVPLTAQRPQTPAPAAAPVTSHARHVAPLSMAVLAGLAGCAVPPPVSRPWTIEPQMGITHALPAQGADAETRNALGVALARRGSLAEAEVQLREAMAMAPRASHVRSNLGRVLMLAGRNDEAIAMLQEAVRLDEADDTARGNLRAAQARVQPAPSEEPPAAAPSVATVDVPLPITQAVVPVPLGASPRDTGLLAEARVEISNGNGVPGMAARVGRWLVTRQGVRGVRLSNQKPYAQRETVVQYRVGHVEAAWRLARLLPGTVRAEPAPASQRGDLRVVLGRDWTRVAANEERMQQASAAEDAPHS